MGPEEEVPSPCIIKAVHVQNKERRLKVSKEKRPRTYKVRSVRITPNFAMKTVKARRTWIDILQTFHRWQSRSPYSAKFSITVDGEK